MKRNPQRKHIVAKFFLQGKTKNVIARELGVSKRTVERDISALIRENGALGELIKMQSKREFDIEKAHNEAKLMNEIYTDIFAGLNGKELLEKYGIPKRKMVQILDRLLNSVENEVKRKKLSKVLEEVKRYQKPKPKKAHKLDLDQTYINTIRRCKNWSIERLAQLKSELEIKISNTKDTHAKNKLIMRLNAVKSLISFKISKEKT